MENFGSLATWVLFALAVVLLIFDLDTYRKMRELRRERDEALLLVRRLAGELAAGVGAADEGASAESRLLAVPKHLPPDGRERRRVPFHRAAGPKPLVSEDMWELQRKATPRIAVGMHVTDSGSGPGVITGITGAGYPRVEGVATAWTTFADGSRFDPTGVRGGPVGPSSNQAGFTIIELLIVIGILGVVAVAAANIASTDGKLSWGVNGVTEERCIAGYVHVVGQYGQPRQILSARGTGIPCDDKPKDKP